MLINTHLNPKGAAWKGPRDWKKESSSSFLAPDHFQPSDIKTPFGKLLPRDPRHGTQMSLDLDVEVIAAHQFPVAGNEIHSPITSKLNFSCLDRDGSHFSDRFEVLRRAGEARSTNAAGITIDPKWLDEVKSFLGPESILRVQTLVGADSSTSEDRFATLASVVAGGSDEVAVVPDYGALRRGDNDAFLSEVKNLLDISGEVPLKLVIDVNSLSEEEIRRAAGLAEQAGVRFVRTDTGLSDNDGPLFGGLERSPVETAKLLQEACGLNIEFAGGVSTLAECKEISGLLKGRRVRFDSQLAGHIAEQEAERQQDGRGVDDKHLAAEMKTEIGASTLAERELLMAHFEEKIQSAQQAGKPVVYLSVPVRGNDAADFDSNVAKAKELVETAEKAGVAYIDPFEVEGTPILTSKGISARAVQELLMDPASGLWPRVLAKCDAIAHAPNWKFSTGAREEQAMADIWDIPNWDGQAPVALKSDKVADHGFYLV